MGSAMVPTFEEKHWKKGFSAYTHTKKKQNWLNTLHLNTILLFAMKFGIQEELLLSSLDTKFCSLAIINTGVLSILNNKLSAELLIFCAKRCFGM